MRAWLCALVLVASGATAVQRPPPAPRPLVVSEAAAPTFTVYGSQAGLEGDAWNSVAFDARGRVWAGSDSGLAWFDGYRWHAMPLPVPNSPVGAMATAPDGALWALFQFAGYGRRDGQGWTTAGTPGEFERFSVVRFDARSELWAYGHAGLWRLDGTQWRKDPAEIVGAGIGPAGFAQSRTLFGEPRQWLGSISGGLWFRRITPGGNEPWQRFHHPLIDRLSASRVIVSRNDAGQEEVWFLSYNNGLARIRTDGVRVWPPGTGGVPAASLLAMAETHGAGGQRDLWVATRAGLLRIHGMEERIDLFDRRHGLPSAAVNDIKVQRLPDGSEALWLATEQGIVRAVIGRGPWTVVSRMGEQGNGVFGVLVEPDGRGGERLWAGSPVAGLSLFEHGVWRTFDKASGALPSNMVGGLWRLPGADGKWRRLLSLVGTRLYEIDDRLALVPLDTPWPLDPDIYASTALARSVDGRVEWWLGTRRYGLYRWRDGRWTAFMAEGAKSPWKVFGLTEQIDGNGKSWLWAATGQGVARFDGQRWSLLQDAADRPAGPDLAIAVVHASAGPQLWLGSNHNGIRRLDVSDPLHPKPLDSNGIPPPPNRMVYSILQDSRGRIWICTNNGVQRLTPQAQGGYQSQVFRRRDGLVHDECNLGAQQVDSHDRYWAGTMGGLGLYDPALEPKQMPKAGPLYVTALRVDAASQDFPGPAALHLPPGDHQLEIDYTLLSGQREDETRYRSRLEGYEHAFTPWTEERRRVFTNLPPGTYSLHIEARDFNGAVQAAAVPTFSIAPHWWQRRLAQAVLAALALLAVMALVVAYNRRLRRRQQQLRRIVAERTRELRAANERLTEMSYLDPLTGVANRRRLTEVLGAEIDRAAAQKLPLGLIMVDIDHFKHYNDRHGHLAGDAALRAVASALASAIRPQDLVARFGGEEFVCLLVESNLPEVMQVAERLRALVEALPPRAIGNDAESLTVSAGVLSLVPRNDDRVDGLLGIVDAALYEAKAAGRNRIVRAELPK